MIPVLSESDCMIFPFKTCETLMSLVAIKSIYCNMCVCMCLGQYINITSPTKKQCIRASILPCCLPPQLSLSAVNKQCSWNPQEMMGAAAIVHPSFTHTHTHSTQAACVSEEVSVCVLVWLTLCRCGHVLFMKPHLWPRFPLWNGPCWGEAPWRFLLLTVWLPVGTVNRT